MNIMFLIDSLCNGGAEKVVSTISSKLSEKEGIEVYVVVDETSEKDYELSKNVNIISLDKYHTKGIQRILVLLKKAKRIKRLKSEYEIDCSISFLPMSNFYNVITKGKEKCFTSVRVLMSEAGYPWYFEYIHKYSMRNCDCIISVSECVKREIKRICNKRVVTIVNPCDIELITKIKDEILPLEVSEIIGKSDFVLVTHGRFEEQKGHVHLIRMMVELVHKNPGTILLLCGEGSLQKKYEELIELFHLDNNVYILGRQRNPFSILSRCDVYVFSSLYEGFPNSLLDAMSVGLPVISSDGASGIRELIAPHTDCEYCTASIEYAQFGVLTPRFNSIIGEYEPIDENELQMIDAIETLRLSMKTREYYAEQSKRRIKDFNVEKITDKWLDIIKG